MSSKKIEISQKAMLECETNLFKRKFQKCFYDYIENGMDPHFNNVSSRELEPSNSQKSYYKKAIVYEGFYNKMYFKLLISYNSIICGFFDYLYNELIFIPFYYGGYDKVLKMGYDIWIDSSDDISPTTCKHIREFCCLSKNEYKDYFNYFWTSDLLEKRIKEKS